jgi:phosphoribosylaminoimidazole carboxylase (NCAIR synthetase)
VNVVSAWQQKAKLAEVSAKADVITGHVEQATAKQVEKIESLHRQVQILARSVADMKRRMLEMKKEP